jgi:hypothetical protein
VGRSTSCRCSDAAATLGTWRPSLTLAHPHFHHRHEPTVIDLPKTFDCIPPPATTLPLTRALQTEAEALLSQARAEAQKQVADAKAVVSAECAKDLAAAKAKVDAELANALASLEAEKAAAMASLDAQVCAHLAVHNKCCTGWGKGGAGGGLECRWNHVKVFSFCAFFWLSACTVVCSCHALFACGAGGQAVR